MQQPRRATVVFIFVTLVLDVLALGIIIPVLPQLVKGFEGGDTASAAKVYGLFGTIWALMQFVASPVLGALSDRFGRRPVILLSNLGLGLDYLLMALAPTLSWLFVGRMVSGITAAGFPTAAAYIADVTPPEKRAGAFGLLGAAFGLGFVLGPALGGLLGHVDPRLPFWVAAGFSVANAAYGAFVLPESLPPERREAFAWKRANPLGSLILLRSHPELAGLSVICFIGSVAHESLPATFVLYAGYRYGWGPGLVGATLAAVGVCSGVVQATLVQPIVARLGERGTLLLGLLAGTVGFAIYGFAATGPWFWVGIPLMAFWGLSGPAANGLMTRHVAPTEQGQLQGAVNSLRGVAGLFSPALFAATFVWAIGAGSGLGQPGAPFLLAALLLAVSAVISWLVTRRELAAERA